MIRIDNINTNDTIKNIKDSRYQKNEEPIFEFNREIEPTKQAKGSIDCWLLSGTNALNNTSWGKLVIKDAIEPDNQGGVYITLKGSPIKNKKFHITVEELYQAKQSKQYSSGDDDMLAIELGVEKLYKIMDSKKLGTIDRCGDDNNPSFLGNMLMDNDTRVQSIEELITGNRPLEIINNTNGQNSWEGLESKDFNKTYKYLSDNSDKISITATFSSRPDALNYRDKNDPVHGNHSYCVNKIVYGKYVILSDPYNSDKNIKMSWERFTSDECLVLFCTAKNEKETQTLLNAYPNNYKTAQENHYKKIKENAKKLEAEELKKQELEKEAEEKRKQEYDWQNIINIFGENGEKKLNDFSPTRPPIKANNVLQFLDKYGTQIISKIDKDVRGLGYGSSKKEYIEPIIVALADLAKTKGIDSNTINNFKNICINQELDAILYTNEKVIIHEVEKILDLINGNK